MKVVIYSGLPERFEGIKVVYFKTEEGYQARILSGIQHRGTNVLLKFKDIDDRESARSVNNIEIFLPEADKIDLPEDHFFIHEIIGSKVYDDDGNFVGELKEVLNAGAGDVFVVRSESREVLIPAVSEFVRSVDVKKHRIVVRLWEDM